VRQISSWAEKLTPMRHGTSAQNLLADGVLFRRNSTSKHGNVISHRPLVRGSTPKTPVLDGEL
jgi:hypothetical protein